MNQNKVHILFVIPSLGRGGAEINTVKLSNYFLSLDYQVTVLVTSDNCQIINEFNKGVNFIIIGRKKLIHSLSDISRNIHNINPNIIFANLWPLTFVTFVSLILSPRFIKRLVIVEHIDLRVALNSRSYLERKCEYIFHFLAPIFVKYIVGVSPGVLTSLKKSSFIYSHKYKLIPNPIYYLSDYSIPKIVKNFNAIPSPLRILAVGNLKPQKDYFTMLNVIRYLISNNYEVRLTIAGDGSLRPQIEKLIRDYQLQSYVSLLGSVNDIKSLFNDNDIYLMTSAWEGFGNSLAESLVAGCRCVSTNCPSGPSYILGDGRYGTLAEVADVKSISEAILREVLIQRFPNEFKESVASFSVERIASLYEELVW